MADHVAAVRGLAAQADGHRHRHTREVQGVVAAIAQLDQGIAGAPAIDEDVAVVAILAIEDVPTAGADQHIVATAAIEFAATVTGLETVIAGAAIGHDPDRHRAIDGQAVIAVTRIEIDGVEIAEAVALAEGRHRHRVADLAQGECLGAIHRVVAVEVDPAPGIRAGVQHQYAIAFQAQGAPALGGDVPGRAEIEHAAQRLRLQHRGQIRRVGRRVGGGIELAAVQAKEAQSEQEAQVIQVVQRHAGRHRPVVGHAVEHVVVQAQGAERVGGIDIPEFTNVSVDHRTDARGELVRVAQHAARCRVAAAQGAAPAIDGTVEDRAGRRLVEIEVCGQAQVHGIAQQPAAHVGPDLAGAAHLAPDAQLVEFAAQALAAVITAQHAILVLADDQAGDVQLVAVQVDHLGRATDQHAIDVQVQAVDIADHDILDHGEVAPLAVGDRGRQGPGHPGAAGVQPQLGSRIEVDQEGIVIERVGPAQHGLGAGIVRAQPEAHRQVAAPVQQLRIQGQQVVAVEAERAGAVEVHAQGLEAGHANGGTGDGIGARHQLVERDNVVGVEVQVLQVEGELDALEVMDAA